MNETIKITYWSFQYSFSSSSSGLETLACSKERLPGLIKAADQIENDTLHVHANYTIWPDKKEITSKTLWLACTKF